MLCVCINGHTAPANWASLGFALSRSAPLRAPLISVAGHVELWAFEPRDGLDLAEMVDGLMADLPQHLAEQALAVWLDDPLPGPAATGGESATAGRVSQAAAFSAGLALEALANVEPLSVMHARLHEAWVMEPPETGLSVYFQPIVDLAHEGVVFAYEALARYRHPTRGLLNGTVIFSAARKARRLEAFERSAQRAALAHKRARLPEGTPLFINALPQTLMLDDLERHPSLLHCERLAIKPEEIVIEISESEQVADLSALAARCEALRDLGFRIALDDFGAGFNGLSAVAAIKPDFIKLDRSLVHGCDGSRTRRTMLESLVQLGERLGSRCIAEGVEAERDLECLAEIGIPYAQGYVIARPAPDPETPRWMLAAARSTSRVAHASASSGKSSIRAATKGPARPIRVVDDVEPVAPIGVDESLDALRQRFDADPSLSAVIVVDRERPIGFIDRARALRGVPGRSGPNVGIGRLVRPLHHVLSGHVPMRQILWRVFRAPHRDEPWVVCDDDGRYLGLIDAQRVLERGLDEAAEQDVHALTRMPTGPRLRRAMSELHANRQGLALIYVDLDRFKAFNDRFGFVRGDAMIKLLAESLRGAFAADLETMVGHIGGDDFVVLAPPASTHWLPAIRRAVARFDALSVHLYCHGAGTCDEADIPPVEDRANVSVVVVQAEGDAVIDSIALGERAARLKSSAKKVTGSVIVWEGPPTRILPLPPPARQGDWQARAFAALEVWLQQAGDRDCVPEGWFDAHPFFELVYRLDAKGVQRYDNWVNPRLADRVRARGRGVDRSGASYYQAIAQGAVRFVSDVYLSRATEDFCVTVAFRIGGQSVDGDILVADINLSGLLELSDSRDAGGVAPEGWGGPSKATGDDVIGLAAVPPLSDEANLAASWLAVDQALTPEAETGPRSRGQAGRSYSEVSASQLT